MKPSTRPAAAASSSEGCRQITRRLRQAGFEVRVAHDLLEALALVQQQPGLLVLLRRRVPQMRDSCIEHLPGVDVGHQRSTPLQPVADTRLEEPQELHSGLLQTPQTISEQRKEEIRCTSVS